MSPTVIVTGGGAGIGEQTSKLFGARGYTVVVTDIAGDEARRVADEISATGGEATSWTLDIGDESQVQSVISRTLSSYGSIAAVVNNAGRNSAARTAAGHIDSAVADADGSVWEADLRTTLVGTMYCCKHAVRAMAPQHGGAIVNITSIEALAGDSQLPAYSAAKAGVVALTRHIAAAYGQLGIRCNAVAPGVILTDAVRRVASEEFLSTLSDTTALGRLGSPNEIAEAIYFLASPASSYVTGQILAADGGATSRLAHARPVTEVTWDDVDTLLR